MLKFGVSNTKRHYLAHIQNVLNLLSDSMNQTSKSPLTVVVEPAAISNTSINRVIKFMASILILIQSLFVEIGSGQSH